MPVDLSYEKFFPFSDIRDEQKKALDFALNEFAQGKRFVVLEMGTGTGKSAVGLTISRYLALNLQQGSQEQENDSNSGTYVLTTQKVLQDQYVDDFGPGGRQLLCSIKSSSNYTCLHYSDQSCGESRRLLSKLSKQLAGTEFANCCRNRCPYAADKQSFIDSSISITNFSYFLSETLYAGKLEPRALLVIDECHNIEDQVGKFIEVIFSEKFFRDVLKCKPPKSDDQDTVMKWIRKTYKPAVSRHMQRLEELLQGMATAGLTSFAEHSKQHDMLDKHICKVNRFLNSYDAENWVLNVIESPKQKKSNKRYQFKPIDVSCYTHDMLYRFGSQVLMMSATIIDKDVFCRSVGIDPADVAFIRLPSPFPIENRLVHYMPVGSMSMKKIDKTLPLMAEAIKALLEQHSDEKGIVHCTNYRVAQFLFENVGSPRLLIHGSDNRDQVLEAHVKSDKPTVLLSPSMTEGVNLADNASRFQVICKVPFPYLGDTVVKKRMTQDPKWYSYQTVKSVIQAVGRSVRNSSDYAVTYILDADWFGFYQRNFTMFPDDFVKSLR